MPDAQADDSACKHWHSDAVQNYLIAYSLSLLSGFPAACFRAEGNGAKLAHMLYCVLFYLRCPLWSCALLTVPPACPNSELFMSLSLYMVLFPIINVCILNTVFS